MPKDWKIEKYEKENINKGLEYQEDDGIFADDLNAIVKNSLWAVDEAISCINTVGKAKTELNENIALKADKSTIPTSVSHLANDLNFTSYEQLSDIEIERVNFNSTSKTFAITKGNGEILTTPIPEATLSNAGLMSPSDLKEIKELKETVNNLSALGVWRATYATKSNLEASFPNLNVTTTIWNANDFIFIIDDESRLDSQGKTQMTSYIVVVNGIIKTLQFRRIENSVVSVATNDMQGLVKGELTATGKVYVETDGTMSVNGWDNLNEKILPISGGTLTGRLSISGSSNRGINVGTDSNDIVGVTSSQDTFGSGSRVTNIRSSSGVNNVKANGETIYNKGNLTFSFSAGVLTITSSV